jgi:hypothetical protein
VVPADLPGRLQVGQPVEEVLDVGSTQRGRRVALVWAAPQGVGQQRERVDLLPDIGGAGAAVAGQLLCRPPLGGPPQPRLGDPGERQSAGMAEHRQVPGVFGLLGAGIGQAPGDSAGQRPQQRPGGLAGNPLGRALRDRGDLVPAERVADRPQVHVGELGSAADALPSAEQHFDDHQRRKPAQADLPAFGDRRLGQLPAPLVDPRVRR